MEDQRVWAFEESLWTADADHYRESIDESALMVVPQPPYVLESAAAVEAVSKTPRWDAVRFSDQRIVRPQEGLIVAAYKVEASKGGGETYVAHCTSTYRRIEHERWTVVQHQQTPPLVAEAKLEAG
ncbi:DUF4440 domain-containing protein [Sphingomonas yunnanensis]|uniref:DUF4440 domain-containing protein n=1 Tax=Sphingomonas yunnanensis TaxID=310400 RepID=UPI001CA7A7DC|nr:DUF4440 domain-containing protein [Sphingomonas yunnanensis]MBY9064444.1 DUF4440 domain-containing protein [Sphingomonas yunnanensis]